MASKNNPNKLKAPRFPRAVVPTGPSVLQLNKKPAYVGGPGNAPEDFIGGATSLSEWYIYWALLKILGPEGDQWAYQESFLGGRYMPGGAVVDFVVYQGEILIGLRIQTYYYHTGSPGGSVKHSSDLEQKVSLEENGMYVIDIYEQNYIHDETGQAAIQQVLMALELVEEFNPRATGQVRP